MIAATTGAAIGFLVWAVIFVLHAFNMMHYRSRVHDDDLVLLAFVLPFSGVAIGWLAS